MGKDRKAEGRKTERLTGSQPMMARGGGIVAGQARVHVGGGGGMIKNRKSPKHVFGWSSLKGGKI